MEGGQERGERGSNHQIGQTRRRIVSPLDSDIEKTEYGRRRLREEVAQLKAQFKEEMEGIDRKYLRLMAENEDEYKHHISILEMNKNKVMLNHYLGNAWRQQPDSHVPGQLLRPACAGSECQTGFLQPYQTVSHPPPPPPPSPSYLRRLLEITNQRQATTSAFYHGTGMTQQDTDPQRVAHVDMMPNYWLTTEAFLTSNFDQSWWLQRRQ